MKELSSLEDLFNKRLFRIPDYQRGYAWGDSQLIDFWEDLMNLKNGRSHYTGVLSIKPINEEVWKSWNNESWLIQQRNHQPVHIVDGQQRLTTCSILIHCIVKLIENYPEYKKRNDSDIYVSSYSLEEIKKQFIYISQPPTHTIKTYKFGYEEDNPSFLFLKHKIFEEPSGGKIDETFYTLNLENAKSFFTDNLNDLIEKSGIEAINTLFEKLTQRMMFNLYELGDDFDVFVAFETMNNRGKKLSDLELLKNRLIYLTTLYDNDVAENDKIAVRENINSAWKEIYSQLGRNKNKPLNDDEFLRAHWIMYFKYSRKKGNDYIRFLLDEEFSPAKVLNKVTVNKRSLIPISESTENDTEWMEEDSEVFHEDLEIEESQLPITAIDKYVKSLKDSAQHWYNTFNPENNQSLTIEESKWIDRLNRINIGYFRPLVMSSFCSQTVSEKERITLLTHIERFIFIVFRLSRAMSNYRNSSYYNVTRELYNGHKSVSDVINLLNEDLKWTNGENGNYKYSYFKDYIYKKFKSGGNGFYGWNGLRYFLFEYEEELMKQRNQPKISWKHFVKSTKDKTSVEHIYPQTATADCWQVGFEDVNTEYKKYYNGSLGNLLPLSYSINSSLQNDCFESKKNVKVNEKGDIIRSGYANGSYSEQEVANESHWGPDEILKRGLKLLSFMESRWQINLGTEENKKDLLHLSEKKETTEKV